MNTTLRRHLAVVMTVAVLFGALGVAVTPRPALAGVGPLDGCAFADVITPTECQITQPWTIGGGGTGANNFDPPLPGPYAFHKTLHILAGGSLQAIGTTGITINIDNAGFPASAGALIMDAGASLIDTSEDGSPPNDGAGPLVITATGGATLASGSVIRSQNTTQGGHAGPIFLTLGASSTLAGTISSEATAGTTSNNGGKITIAVTGNLVLTPTAVISSEKNADSGRSGEIVISVSGDMTMQGTGPGGALITSNHPGATNGTPGGNITITVGTGDAGVFTMQPGTLVDSGGRGRAGNIAITAGDRVDVQAGASVLAGQMSEQDTQGHGGRIFVIAGCEASIFGTLSSQGRDPGADLVHVSGCEVHVGPSGLIESTGHGHAPSTPTSCDGIDDPDPDGLEPGGDAGEVLRGDHPDDSSFCVEIWARHVTIDAGGELNADFALGGGTQGHAWIDIFAETDITLNGRPAGDATWAVHANSGLGNDVGGDVRVVARNDFVNLSGQAIQANATLNGGSGGTVLVEAGGNLAFGDASVQAMGSAGTNAGHIELGGTITGRSYTGTLTGAAPGELNTFGFDANGTVTLQRCVGVVADYSGTVIGTLVTPPNACAPATPPIPTYVVFNPGGRWDRCGTSSVAGVKFNDLDGDGVRDGGEPGLSGWTITLWNATQTVALASMNTAGDGSYGFIGLVPGTYVLCETPQAGWTQTAPGPGTPCANGTNGHTVNLTNGGACCGGVDLPGIDFGNRQRVVTCPEDPNRAAMLTQTVKPGEALGGGGVPGNPANYHSVQAAYDAAKALTNQVIGLFSKTTENLVLNGSRAITITQCTNAQVTAANANAPVWWITGTGKHLIIGPDSVGGSIGWLLQTGGHELKSIRANGASAAGVRILSNGNAVSWNDISGNAIGLDVLGSTNKLRGSTIGGNSASGVHFAVGANSNTLEGATIQGNGGNGVWVEGASNIIKSNKLFGNAPNGIRVSGASNTVQSNTVETSSGDGINVTGMNNLFEDNKVSKNTGDGFEIAAGGNRLKNNASNNGSSGGSTENGGHEYRLTVAAVNQGGNRADGVTVPKATAPTKCPTFPAASTCE